jgi:Zn-dependent M28 family amino/carboxypeptidase
MHSFSKVLFFIFINIHFVCLSLNGQQDNRLFDIANAPKAKSIEAYIRTLTNFGTRSTLSDTVSNTRGIGAARRWIHKEFNNISSTCNNCLEVSYLSEVFKTGFNPRIKEDIQITNVIAIQRGSVYPDRYVIMTADIDSRVTDVLDAQKDNPGANDNASGMAGVLEAANILSKYTFPTSIVYIGLSGEEQGLLGGTTVAKYAKNNNWDIIGVLNNDMIGNIEGVDGIIDNSTFRIFSEPVSTLETERERAWHRVYGGEVDGPSRQIARYIDKLTDLYCTNLDAKMIYRLDRFGRGGHHKPFNDEGFPGVRIMETHENYYRQHEDIRVENGIKYGDVIEGVNFDYAAKLTGVNAITLAALAWAPPPPEEVQIGGIVQSYTRLKWKPSTFKGLVGHKIYWRETTSAQWQFSRFVPKEMIEITLEKIIIDNFLFGIASVGLDGNESVVVYPTTLISTRR